MKYTEKHLEAMASPISKSEEEKCKNALKMVRDAMKLLDYTDGGNEIRRLADETFSFALNMHQKNTNKKITLLVQGSYANKTNISSESDVDVAVILESTFFPLYRPGVNGNDYGFIPGSFTVKELKNEVEIALRKHFKNQGVERHDKCIKVRGNTYRVDADVVPAYRYRDYSNDWSYKEDNYIGGIVICPDRGGQIINYPEQHIQNGKTKNKNSNYKFKKCVRIAKNMRKEMEENGCKLSDKISSFGIESLLWNVPPPDECQNI